MVRDPLWQNVCLDPVAAALVDTPHFQRLRRVKQLGFAHLVYPGAVHTRFMHALGVYHLVHRATRLLDQKGVLAELDQGDRERIPLVRLAALLHDVGHYAFSHAMEEVMPAAIPGYHEEMAARCLEEEPIRRALAEVDPEAAERIMELIRGRSAHPLGGLISGSLDLDKIDYLKRDSFFCGVPYGAVDVERLLDSLTLAREAPASPLEVAVTEKGISALESLLFAKYQMFRNVYWHHTVRAATSLFRRTIERAVEAGILVSEELPGRTDEELLADLVRASSAPEAPPELSRPVFALMDRQLPKRAIEMFGDDLPGGIAPWLQTHPALVRRLEDRLALEWGTEHGSVFVDYPSKPQMLELRMLLVDRRGEVRRLTSSGEVGLIDLPRLGASLHHATRVFRVFTLSRLEPRDPGPLLELLESPAEEVEVRLAESSALY